MQGADGGQAAVRAELSRILASPAFGAAEQLRRMLRFVVEETLAGRGDRLKAYTVAVEALGRPESFDPQTDASVRVLAGRLRKSLAQHYRAEGRGAEVMIELPAGGYRPVFRSRAVHSPAAARSRGLPRAAVIAGGLLVLVLAALSLWHWPQLASRNDEVTHASDLGAWRNARVPPDPLPSVLMTRRPLLLIHAENAEGGADARDWPSAAEMAGGVSAALARFDDLVVVRVEDLGAADGTGGDPGDRAGREVYHLQLASQPPEDGRRRLVLLLSHQPTGHTVLARSVALLPGGWVRSLAPDGEIGRILSEIAEPYGVIFADARNRSALRSEPEIDYPCLRTVFEYWLHPTAQRFRAAGQCLERTRAQNPGFAPAHANAVFLLVEARRLGHDRRPVEEARQEVLALANAAMAAAPASARSNSALAAAYMLSGDLPQAVQAAARAVELNPYDPELVADLGAKLVLSGAWQAGRARLLDAIEAGGPQPPWRRFFVSVASALLNDPEAARFHAQHIPPEAGARRGIALLLAASGRPAALESAWAGYRRDYPADVDIRATLARYVPVPFFVETVAERIGPPPPPRR